MQGSDNLLLLAQKEQSELSPERQRSLVLAYQSGDTNAGGELIVSQSAWIMKLLKSANLPPDVDYDDMLSELSIVLLNALKSYDPSKSKLTTFVSWVVFRRMPRIARTLRGRWVNETVDNDRLDLIPEDEPDDRIATILEAMDRVDLKPEAKDAIRLWADGFKSSSILARLSKKYPRTDFGSVNELIDDALRTIRSEVVAMGCDLPAGAELQKEFW